jgi:hypothetical protein
LVGAALEFVEDLLSSLFRSSSLQKAERFRQVIRIGGRLLELTQDDVEEGDGLLRG